jgi:hypothetical protein
VGVYVRADKWDEWMGDAEYPLALRLAPVGALSSSTTTHTFAAGLSTAQLSANPVRVFALWNPPKDPAKFVRLPASATAFSGARASEWWAASGWAEVLITRAEGAALYCTAAAGSQQALPRYFQVDRNELWPASQPLPLALSGQLSEARALCVDISTGTRPGGYAALKDALHTAQKLGVEVDPAMKEATALLAAWDQYKAVLAAAVASRSPADLQTALSMAVGKRLPNDDPAVQEATRGTINGAGLRRPSLPDCRVACLCSVQLATSCCPLNARWRTR